MTTRMVVALIASVAALSSLAGHAAAQQGVPKPGAEEIQQRIAAAKAKLNLTPEQESRLRPLLQEEVETLRALEAKYGANPSGTARRARLKEMRAARQDFRGKLSSILSKDQLAEWDKLRDQAVERARERRSAK